MEVEMELVSSEVALIHAALCTQAADLSDLQAGAYEQLAQHLDPIGLYVFTPPDTARICLALHEYAKRVRLTDAEQAEWAQVLSDQFLNAWYMAFLAPSDFTDSPFRIAAGI